MHGQMLITILLCSSANRKKNTIKRHSLLFITYIRSWKHHPLLNCKLGQNMLQIIFYSAFLHICKKTSCLRRISFFSIQRSADWLVWLMMKVRPTGTGRVMSYVLRQRSTGPVQLHNIHPYMLEYFHPYKNIFIRTVFQKFICVSSRLIMLQIV